MRNDLTDSLCMIQPTLMSYSFNAPATPALLDVGSIAPDRILMLDTFFYVIIFHGDTVASWRKARYQDQPDHANFRKLLQAPRDDAEELLSERNPHPRFVDCDQYGSQVCTASFPLLYRSAVSQRLLCAGTLSAIAVKSFIDA